MLKLSTLRQLWTQTLRCLYQPTRPVRRRPRRRRPVPALEWLSQRIAPAVTATFLPSDAGVPALIVKSDAQGDTITVSRDAAGNLHVNSLDAVGNPLPVAIAGGAPTVANTALIEIFGGDG